VESTYLNLINDNLRAFVENIEGYIDSEIEIEIDNSRENKLACEMDKNGAKILIPEENIFPNESVFHELLHINRFCLCGIPKIVVCEESNDWNPVFDSAIAALDNNIEHFVIVPEECSVFGDRIVYWKERTRNAIEQLHSRQLSNDDIQRHALVNWAFSKYVIKDAELEAMIDANIEKMELQERTSPFLEDIIKYIDNKEKLANIFVKHLELPMHAVCLEYLDLENKDSCEKPLVDVQL